jgi:hypothetical protein
MAKRPHQAPAKKRRHHHHSLGTEPRSEIVFDKRKLSGLLAELKSLSERGGSALGDAYARAASSFLNRSEQLADQSAERRFRQRSKARPPASTHVPVRAISADATSSTRK